MSKIKSNSLINPTNVLINFVLQFCKIKKKNQFKTWQIPIFMLGKVRYIFVSSPGVPSTLFLEKENPTVLLF